MTSAVTSSKGLVPSEFANSMMMKEMRRSSLWLRAAAIVLIIGVSVAWLGWDPGPSPHEVYVCIIPYERFQDYEHHLVPYSAGMTIQDAVNAAIQKRGLPPLNQSEMAPIIDRHLVWTWRAACRRVLDALINFLQKSGFEGARVKIMVWQAEHDLGGNPHGWRVDAAHSRWTSEALPNDSIRVFARDELER